MPEVVYTNDEIIDRLFSYLNEGQIQEVVERSLESEESDKGGGIDKIIQLRYSKTAEDEEEQELIRELDPIGKFAILHRHLQDADDITEFEALSPRKRSELEEGEFIQTRSRITSTPITELQGMMEEVMPYFDMFDIDTTFEEEGQEFTMDDIKQFLDQLGSGEDIYRLDASSDSLDANIVFSSEDTVGDLSSEYTEYYVLGRVEYLFDEGEEEWLIDIMDVMPGSDRDSRQNRRMFLKQMTSGSSKLLEKDIDESDFKIGYPDIRIRPMAIYLY
ncbi:hypothetical protein D8Y22_15525 [Salinadaptatus halalkaliphilus]|uniref:Uncharacterized protein n=1 Tax=Salinadaptatus halalkaliphilus TaxID=2419781 RepID=A0A4S3TI76_9EURY|nr:hypothetical protein D8Y22_15525 [Salinadaptatus halalkaliphilus]